jgi:transposase-like protein
MAHYEPDWLAFKHKMIMRGVSTPEADRMREAFLAGACIKDRARPHAPYRARRRYTREDLDNIIRLRAAGRSWSEVAQELGRSVGSLKNTRRHYMLEA